MDPRKAAAEWFYNTVFKDEAIQPRAVPKPERVPAAITAARSLEIRDHRVWQSRESIFLKQGKLLASYEDDYDFSDDVACYYPTYQSLTDRQLRGYFSWRTKLRGGDVRKSSLSFAFLYIYELLNQIGVENPLDGFHKLESFRDAYGQLDKNILPYLKRWLVDYVVYYSLAPDLLADTLTYDRSISVLEHIQEEEPEKIISAVKRLAPNRLEKSKFYTASPEDMDAVIVRVLRRMSLHYDSKCKKTLVEQYFGTHYRCYMRMMDAAVFSDPLKRRNYEYKLSDQRTDFCANGAWSVWMRTGASSKAKLGDLLKTIDSVMRQEANYRYPVKAGLDTKWILRMIQEETEKLYADKKAAEEKKFTINYAQLTQIRQDAAVTQEKLTVEEEAEEAPVPQEEVLPSEAPAETEDTPLEPAERRFLQCLLYDRDITWVQAEGYLLSVLVDGINEKLYDTFLDSVLDDTPQLIADYIDDLKEMIHP